jgi:hypothetical protein
MPVRIGDHRLSKIIHSRWAQRERSRSDVDEDGSHSVRIKSRSAVGETTNGDDRLLDGVIPFSHRCRKHPIKGRSALGLIRQSRERLPVAEEKGQVLRNFIEWCTESPG